jgi:hypothetical protein
MTIEIVDLPFLTLERDLRRNMRHAIFEILATALGAVEKVARARLKIIPNLCQNGPSLFLDHTNWKGLRYVIADE